MSKRLMSITSKTSEQKALGLIIDELLDSKKPNVADAIRLCAIPHWFDEKILAWLCDEGREPSERTGAILAELADLAFVSPRRDHGYVYLENVRNLLLGRWQKENAELFRNFKKLSGMVAAYYADILQIEEPSEEQRAEYEREEMYHLLVSDEGHGVGLFINLLERSGQLYQLSTFDLLLDLASEQRAHLSASNRHWIPFFEGKRALLSGDWEKTLKVWETLAGEREQLPVDLEKMLATHLSFLYKDNGQWEKAVECFRDSLEILEKGGDERGKAAIFNNLGFLYKDKDLWDDAEKCFQRSLEILEETGDKGGMAATYNNLGLLSKDREKWKDADKYFQLGLTNLENTDDERGMVTILNNLGFLYKDRKNWKEAVKYFQRALKILKKMCDGPRIADTFNYLGFLYRDKEEWDEANRYFQDALEILKNMGDERGMASVFNNLGILYKSKGECEKAAYFFLRSLKIVEKVGDEMNAATTMYELAMLYKDMEEYDEAIELLEKVVNICNRVGHPDLKVRGSRETLAKVKAMAMSNESASGK